MRVYVDSTVYEIFKLFSFTFRKKYKQTVNYKSATEAFEMLYIYLRTSGCNGILEKTGGQVSKANIFERPDLSSRVKEKVCFKFGPNYLTNRGSLKFCFCRKWKLHTLRRVLVWLYSFIAPVICKSTNIAIYCCVFQPVWCSMTVVVLVQQFLVRSSSSQDWKMRCGDWLLSRWPMAEWSLLILWWEEERN
jgi:hypothetical protein